MQRDLRGDPALGVNHHRPRHLGDLACAKASLGRERNDRTISIAVPAPAGSPQQAAILSAF